jgi:hypothetical protein
MTRRLGPGSSLRFGRESGEVSASLRHISGAAFGGTRRPDFSAARPRRGRGF